MTTEALVPAAREPAIRTLGDWLVVSQVLPVNPAAAVRGPKHVVAKGATPVLPPAEASRRSRHHPGADARGATQRLGCPGRLDDRAGPAGGRPCVGPLPGDGRLMRDAGVPILAGTDQAPDGASLHRELELLVETGLSPLEAITAATSRATAFLGLTEELGTVEAGKRADLVLLDGDPLAAIRNTRRIDVVVGGVLLDRAELGRWTATAPGPAQSDSRTELHRWLDARRRSIRLADLLIEVENDLGFSVHFQQPGGKRVDPRGGVRAARPRSSPTAATSASTPWRRPRRLQGGSSTSATGVSSRRTAGRACRHRPRHLPPRRRRPLGRRHDLAPTKGATTTSSSPSGAGRPAAAQPLPGVEPLLRRQPGARPGAEDRIRAAVRVRAATAGEGAARSGKVGQLHPLAAAPDFPFDPGLLRHRQPGRPAVAGQDPGGSVRQRRSARRRSGRGSPPRPPRPAALGRCTALARTRPLVVDLGRLRSDLGSRLEEAFSEYKHSPLRAAA